MRGIAQALLGPRPAEASSEYFWPLSRDGGDEFGGKVKEKKIKKKATNLHKFLLLKNAGRGKTCAR